jgi:hypothetical protein
MGKSTSINLNSSSFAFKAILSGVPGAKLSIGSFFAGGTLNIPLGIILYFLFQILLFAKLQIHLKLNHNKNQCGKKINKV